MSESITVSVGQKVHYHDTAWGTDTAVVAKYVELSATDYAVILPSLAEFEERDWVCGMDDGTLCVEDIAHNRETTESMVLQDGMKAVAIDPDNQAACDHWAELYADCWQ